MKKSSAWLGTSIVAALLLMGGRASRAGEPPASLEPNGTQTLKRVNETLSRAGFPVISIAPGAAQIAVALSPGASRSAQSAILSPMTPAAAAALDPVDEEKAARARGITEEQAEELHHERGLAYADILTLPNSLLAKAIFEQEREAGDHPQEAMEYEESFKVTEKGKPTPADLELARQQALALPLNTALLPADVPAAMLRGQAVTAQSVTPTSWTWRGPGNVGGRIRSMLIHPTQPSRMWVGSVGGGIWYSSNAGASWAPVNDFMGNLAVSTLAFDPTNANTMYAGTGEGFYNADGIRGAGIYKSTDSGVTWAQLSATANGNFLTVQSLAFSPDGSTLLAATGVGIFRSVDGGAAWTSVYTNSNRVGHVEFSPADSVHAVASGYGAQTLYSANGGVSWTAATGGPAGGTGSSGGRVEVRYARSNATIVYAAFDFGTASQLFKSGDGGVTYAKVFDSATAGTNHWLGAQGWYDNLVWISPVNPSLVVVGGVDLYRSTNAGVTFTKISEWQSAPTSAHADHHFAVADPGFNGTSNNNVYFLNDGGIYQAANVSTVATTSGWQELNNQLGITQFYGAGMNAANGTIVAGAQDNGTLRSTAAGGSEAWTAMFGGDGGYSAADQSNSAYFYGEYVYLEIHRSTNSGGSSSYIYSGITDAGTSAAEFIAPFILDPNNQATLLAGGSSLWRTTDARAATVSWASIKPSISSHITAVAVAPGNSDQIWVGHLNGAIYLTVNGTAATPTWTLVSTGTPARRVTRLVVDPQDATRVYATFGGYSSGNLWRTTNRGGAWTNVTGTLPAAPIYGVAIAPLVSQTLYAATDVGVFASDDGGTTWSGTNIGPTLASTQEIFVSGSTLVAVTHGRGVFTTPAPTTDTTPPTLSIAPSDGSPTNASPVTFRLNWNEPVTGFAASDVQVQGASGLTLTGANASYTATVTPLGNPAAITVSVAAGAAQDLAGNANVTGASAALNYSQQSPFLYATAFDGAAAPTGWSADGDWRWGVPTSGPGADHTGGGGKLYATGLTSNYLDGDSEYLTSPAFTLPATGLPYKLRFWMWLNAEAGYDGGNVEISVNGAAYTVVPSASLSVPYNSTAISSMPGGAGWSSNTLAAWNRVRLDLGAYAGSTVQFRFHFTSDSTVNFPGWFLDDFALEQDPLVTVTATDPTAADGGNAGTATISLAPAAPGPLTIGYTAGGTAGSGTDYTALSGAATVAAGAQSAAIPVNAINRGGARPKTLTVILALANGTGYTVGSPNTATVYVAGEAGYDAWRAARFTDAEFANDAISGPTADPDGDGIANVLEYSLGLNPKTPDANGLPAPKVVNVAGSNYLSLTIVKPQADTDLTYAGQVSGNLTTWTGDASAVSTTVQPNVPSAGFDTVTYRDLTPLGSAPNGAKRFLRLNVTKN